MTTHLIRVLVATFALVWTGFAVAQGKDVTFTYVELSLKNRLPTAAGPREFVEAGGLVAYGPHYPDLFHRSATYVDRILINLKTAKALGLTIPASVLARADDVME